MSIPLSITDKDGVDVGRHRNLAYLYGLSDFFSYVFEDSETTNLMLEANSLSASDIYSNFLQLTSSISLSTVQENLGVSIKLLLIKKTDQQGTSPIFLVNQPLASIAFLTNRPFLPTETLEEGVDYRVSQIDDSSCTIRFAKAIEEYKFSKRIGIDGVDEYALWATDTKVDASLMYKYFGKILGVTPEVSSEQFSNFIYGLYYLYSGGPSLKVMEQGLNLVLGIPLSRGEEKVIDIRRYLESDQYLVISDANQYLLPTGVVPGVNIGDLLSTGSPIARWIELKDYTSAGKWWIGVSIPTSIIRQRPGGQISRFPTEGDQFDVLMTQYLKKNTFLIRINLGANASTTHLEDLLSIVVKAKPAHAQPVYVWRVLFDDDFFDMEDELLSTTQVPSIMSGINWVPINELKIG
jgi:hypothetical protein